MGRHRRPLPPKPPRKKRRMNKSVRLCLMWCGAYAGIAAVGLLWIGAAHPMPCLNFPMG